MDTIQMMGSIRQDEECRAAYAEYLQFRGKQEKARKKRRLLILAVALPIAALIALAIGGVGVLLVVLVIIALVVSEVWSGKYGDQRAQAWEKSGAQIVRSAVQAYFRGSRYDERQINDERKDILQGIIAADKQRRDHRIKGEWRGKAFYACHAELLWDGGEDADETLFDGLILEVEAHPALDASLAARLEDRKYNCFVGKRIKGEARELIAEETQRVFRLQWMEDLASAGGYYPVMACVKTVGQKRFVQVGVGDVTSVVAEETDVSYDEFVNRVAESLERMQRLLDVIISNEALF